MQWKKEQNLQLTHQLVLENQQNPTGEITKSASIPVAGLQEVKQWCKKYQNGM